MAQGDIITMVASGTYCGEPVAISMAYRQDRDDPANVTPGRDLALSWFTGVGGPWWFFQNLLCDDLKWDCVSTAWPGNADTTFLQNIQGSVNTPATPSPICAQVNVPALRPHENKHEGRFYLPGIPVAAVQRSGFTQLFQSNVQVPLQAMLRISSVTDFFNNAYYLVPHAKYVDDQGTSANAEAYLPYLNLFLKALGARKTNACGAFLGGGGGDFNPGVGPDVPTVTLTAPQDAEVIAPASGVYEMLGTVTETTFESARFLINGAEWGEPGTWSANYEEGLDRWSRTKDVDEIFVAGDNTIIFEGVDAAGMQWRSPVCTISFT